MLERQVRRMLADPKREALVTNFAGQWLQLRNLRNVQPNSDLFPDFDDNLRQSFRRETELFFESVDAGRPQRAGSADGRLHVRERTAGPALRHSRFYGSHFRRVAITDDARRGLLGQGSILAVTSHAERTSPVVRGKWILENMLGTPCRRLRPTCRALKEIKTGEKPQNHARADGGASRQPGLRQLPQDDGSDRFRAGELRRRGRLAHAATRAVRSMPRASWPTARRSTAWWRCARRWSAGPDLFAGTLTRKAADLRAGPGPGLSRHAGGARNRARCIPRQLPFFVADSGGGPQHAVPDENGAWRREPRRQADRRKIIEEES